MHGKVGDYIRANKLGDAIIISFIDEEEKLVVVGDRYEIDPFGWVHVYEGRNKVYSVQEERIFAIGVL